MLASPRQPASDDDEDESESESDSSSLSENSLFTPLPPPVPNPHLRPGGYPPRSYTNLLAVTINNISGPMAPHPLMHNPSLSLFPRSVNPHGAVSHTNCVLRAHMLKNHVLQRLESAHFRPLSNSEELSIRPFGTRPPRPLPPRRPTRLTEEEAIQRIGGSAGRSRGLKRWAERPCFEERVLVWKPDEFGGLEMSKVVASSNVAVAALEFSDGLEALAGLAEDGALVPSRTASANKCAVISIHLVLRI